MAQSYSARSRAIEPFHVMALLARANELQAAGLESPFQALEKVSFFRSAGC